MTRQDYTDLMLLYSCSCYYCDLDLTDPDNKFHWDHKIPLFHGGKTTKENIVPSCQRCNTSKGSMSEIEFIESRIKFNLPLAARILTTLDLAKYPAYESPHEESSKVRFYDKPAISPSFE